MFGFHQIPVFPVIAEPTAAVPTTAPMATGGSSMLTEVLAWPRREAVTVRVIALPRVSTPRPRSLLLVGAWAAPVYR